MRGIGENVVADRAKPQLLLYQNPWSVSTCFPFHSQMYPVSDAASDRDEFYVAMNTKVAEQCV